MPVDAHERARRLLAALAQSVVEALAERGRTSTEEEVVDLVLRGWGDERQLERTALREELRPLVRALLPDRGRRG